MIKQICQHYLKYEFTFIPHQICFAGTKLDSFYFHAKSSQFSSSHIDPSNRNEFRVHNIRKLTVIYMFDRQPEAIENMHGKY